MFLISSEFWPKLAHHHRHSGLTSFWVARSKRPVMRLLECVVLPRLCSGTHAAHRGTVANQMSRSCCYIARRRHSCFFLWGIHFTFYILHYHLRHREQKNIPACWPASLLVSASYRVRICSQIPTILRSHIVRCLMFVPGCWWIPSPTRKETTSEACQGRALFQ